MLTEDAEGGECAQQSVERTRVGTDRRGDLGDWNWVCRDLVRDAQHSADVDSLRDLEAVEKAVQFESRLGRAVDVVSAHRWNSGDEWSKRL
jgi:hypothetical protein